MKQFPFAEIIREDDDNVRTIYDANAHLELMDSIRSAGGLLQNLGVILDEEGKPRLKFGFRRGRAIEALLAADIDAELRESIATVWCKVYSPDEVRKAERDQLIENLQREGLDPVDEARSFRRALSLRDDGGQLVYPTQADLAAAIGKDGVDRSYVSRRLRLLDAPDFLLDAIRAGTPAGIGEAIGAMPSLKDREEMARLALKHPHLGIPMSLDQVKEYIRQHFCQPLKNCGFDAADADLLPVHERGVLGFTGAKGEKNDGSCDRCSLRSGNAEDFSHEGGANAWMCMNPGCFKVKLGLQWDLIKRQTEESGNRLMTDTVARGLFEKGVMISKDYVTKEHRPGYDFTGHHAEEEMPRWGEIFTGEKVSWLVCRVPGRKDWCYLLEADKALELAEAKWKREGQPNLFAKRPVKAAKAVETTTTVTTVKIVDSGTVDSGTVGQTEEEVKAQAVVTLRASNILEEQWFAMARMHKAWREGHSVCGEVEAMLVTSRLSMIPVSALRLMCYTLCDEAGEVIGEWGNDACVRTLLRTGEEPAYLMMLAEMALVLVRDNPSTLELLKVIQPVFEDE